MSVSEWFGVMLAMAHVIEKVKMEWGRKLHLSLVTTKNMPTKISYSSDFHIKTAAMSEGSITT